MYKRCCFYLFIFCRVETDRLTNFRRDDTESFINIYQRKWIIYAEHITLYNVFLLLYKKIGTRSVLYVVLCFVINMYSYLSCCLITNISLFFCKGSQFYFNLLSNLLLCIKTGFISLYDWSIYAYMNTKENHWDEYTALNTVSVRDLEVLKEHFLQTTFDNIFI